MLATFILGILAGAGAPYAEPHVKKAIEGMLLSEAPLTATELRMFSFAACLVAAAVLAWIFGNGSAFALALGAALGVFGPRLIDRVQKRKIPDYSDDA
ncbi:MAG: hypothetical protein HKN63_10405 [Rhodobacteraceae bacterium]|nr:hypothetical protein [Paracoccaceae bacterium]